MPRKRAVFIIDRDGIIRWSKLDEQRLPDNDERLSVVHDLPRQEVTDLPIERRWAITRPASLYWYER
jgi:alkyl hydroperoxide reductase subunit AhpC